MTKRGEGQVSISKRSVDAIKPTGKDFYVFDSDLIGFGVRVRASGAMSYIVRYRAGSGREAPTKRITIAPVGKITPTLARERAKDILASVVKGDDPAKIRSDTRTALKVSALVEKYLAEVEAKHKPATHYLYTHLLNNYALPTLSKRLANGVTTADLSGLHLKLKDTPSLANRFLSVVSAMYNWAIRTKLLAKMENPAAGIQRYKEDHRERYLTSEELGRLGDAIKEAETIGIPWAPDPEKKIKHAPKEENRRVKIDADVAAALRLYLLTGARRGEILGLTWDMVDLERGVLLLPDSKSGKKTIILNGPAIFILSNLPRVDRYVIPGRPRKRPDGSMESRPRSDLKRPWIAVRKRAGLAGDADNPHFRVRLHDLRHTHASVGVGSNFGLPIVGKILGHTQVRTTQRYAHLEVDPVRAASETIGIRILTAMEGGATGPKAEVVPIKKR